MLLILLTLIKRLLSEYFAIFETLLILDLHLIKI